MLPSVLITYLLTCLSPLVRTSNRITAFHLYPESKYLLVGTEEGSVRVIDIEGFHLSTYKIASKKVRKGALPGDADPTHFLDGGG